MNTRTRTILQCGAAAVLASALTSPVWADALDCAKHLQAAEASIDKVTEDMKGMEMMPKSQLADVHALLSDAKRLAQGAHRDCDQAGADLDKARGLAQADAARGYATAADILHWQYMKPMHGMHMKSGSASMDGMKMSASTGASSMTMQQPAVHTHGMSMAK